MTDRGLTSHIQQTAGCAAKDLGTLLPPSFEVATGSDSLAFQPVFTAIGTTSRKRQATKQKSRIRNDKSSNPEEEVDDFGVINDDNEDQSEKYEGDEGQEDYDLNPVAGRPDSSILESFQDYVEQSLQNTRQFLDNEVKTIELMGILRESKASLRTYEEIMRWHYLVTGQLKRHEGMGKVHDFISRKKIFQSLEQRYNYKDKLGIIDTITLPSSNARAKIVRNDFKYCLWSLLADPRIEDDDYLFFDDNPWAAPPELSPNDKENFIGDINTGRAYRESYVHYIRKPGKQVLLPLILYIDGAATGQFANLPVTPLKFTLGIFNRKAREKPHMWRTLGYVPAFSAERSRGRRQLAESGHVDAQMAMQDLLQNEGNLARKNGRIAKAQDHHAILAHILKDVYKVMKTGFFWDLVYKDRVYRSLEFVLFVPFLKVDNEEADKLCGSFTSRTKNIKQLCRYCCCPTSECDNPKAKHRRKTVKMIQRLVDLLDEVGLKDLSQQMITNALYPLRFGAHNGEGPHTACPLEMLHSLLLGIFKYVRDCFFTQIGETSKNAVEINSLAVEFGELYHRQSDRDKPKTKFSNGIQKGKLMAKEYRGVLLIMATILASTKGRLLLRKKKSGIFATEDGLHDWKMLVETLLMWEVWLKSEEISHYSLKRAKVKHRYIMYLIRKVGKRTKGMGLKIMKYHAIVHMADDIMNFGVPMNYDTGADEAGHKPSKSAAKLTQKNKDTFDQQVSTRLAEKLGIDLAMHEIGTGRTYWRYYKPRNNVSTLKRRRTEPARVVLGGGEIEVIRGDDGNPAMKMRRKIQGSDKMKVEVALVNFLHIFLEMVSAYIEKPCIRTQYTDDAGTIFRAAPLFKGGVWRDWVMVDWEGYDPMPNKLWGFLDLSSIPEDNDIEYGGLLTLEPGVYAIVESSEVDESRADELQSEIFVPITTEVGEIRDNRVRKLKYYLAPVRAFMGPAIVIPDIGGRPNGYLMLKPRETWRKDFDKWLATKYEQFDDFEEDPDQTDYEEEESDLEYVEEEDEVSEDES